MSHASNDIVLALVIITGLSFDFTNGFHDTANAMATSIVTKALSPRIAVALSAALNLVGAFLSLSVAATIASGLVDTGLVTLTVVFAGLAGAIVWNLITWFYGLPTSSSHALMGGYAGAAIAKAGFGSILLGGWTKTVLFLFLAPVIGMVLGFCLMVLLMWTFHRRSSSRVNIAFRKLQLLSAALYSLGHGTNDAQKTMGIITGLLLTAGILKTFEVPFWVIIMSHMAIALGTLFGGWRIVKTMGQKITKLKPAGGFCAETAGGVTLLITAWGGIPVSTTHTITGAIMGVGATKRLSGVRWGVAGNIIGAWILTIPASAMVGAIAYGLISMFL